MGRLEVLVPVTDRGRGKRGRARHMCQRTCTEHEAMDTAPGKTVPGCGRGAGTRKGGGGGQERECASSAGDGARKEWDWQDWSHSQRVRGASLTRLGLPLPKTARGGRQGGGGIPTAPVRVAQKPGRGRSGPDKTGPTYNTSGGAGMTTLGPPSCASGSGHGAREDGACQDWNHRACGGGGGDRRKKHRQRRQCQDRHHLPAPRQPNRHEE